MSDLGSFYSPLTIQMKNDSIERQDTEIKQLVTDRTTERTYSVQGQGVHSAEQSGKKYQFGSTSLKGNQSMWSPIGQRMGLGLAVLDNKIPKSIGQYVSYGGGNKVPFKSEIRGDQFLSKYQSPSQKVTEFDLSSFKQNQPLTEISPIYKTETIPRFNELKSIVKKGEMTSEIQYGLYKNPQQRNYQYQSIFNQYANTSNGSQKVNDVKLSPISNLQVNKKPTDYHSEHFHTYSIQKTNNVPVLSHQNTLNGKALNQYSRDQVRKQKQNYYNTLNKYQAKTNTYEPLLATQSYTLDNQQQLTTSINQIQQRGISIPTQSNVLKQQQTAFLISNQGRTHYVPQSANVKSQNNYLPTYQTHLNSPNYQIQKDSNYETQLDKNNLKISDEIQRPEYVRINKPQVQEIRRFGYDKDPINKKTHCGPLLWIPLVILGLAMVSFGMLCGLGIVCFNGSTLQPSLSKQSEITNIQPIVIEPVKPNQQPIIQPYPVSVIQPIKPLEQPTKPIDQAVKPIEQPVEQVKQQKVEQVTQIQPIKQTVQTATVKTQTTQPSILPNVGQSQISNVNNNVGISEVVQPDYTWIEPQVTSNQVIQTQSTYYTGTYSTGTTASTQINNTNAESISPVNVIPQPFYVTVTLPQQPSTYNQIQPSITTFDANIQPSVSIEPVNHIEPQVHIQPDVIYTTYTQNTYPNTQYSSSEQLVTYPTVNYQQQSQTHPKNDNSYIPSQLVQSKPLANQNTMLQTSPQVFPSVLFDQDNLSKQIQSSVQQTYPNMQYIPQNYPQPTNNDQMQSIDPQTFYENNPQKVSSVQDDVSLYQEIEPQAQ